MLFVGILSLDYHTSPAMDLQINVSVIDKAREIELKVVETYSCNTPSFRDTSRKTTSVFPPIFFLLLENLDGQ